MLEATAAREIAVAPSGSAAHSIVGALDAATPKLVASRRGSVELATELGSTLVARAAGSVDAVRVRFRTRWVGRSFELARWWRSTARLAASLGTRARRRPRARAARRRGRRPRRVAGLLGFLRDAAEVRTQTAGAEIPGAILLTTQVALPIGAMIRVGTQAGSNEQGRASESEAMHGKASLSWAPRDRQGVLLSDPERGRPGGGSTESHATSEARTHDYARSRIR